MHVCKAFCFQTPTGRSHDFVVFWMRLQRLREARNVGRKRCDPKFRSGRSMLVDLCVESKGKYRALTGPKSRYFSTVRNYEDTSKSSRVTFHESDRAP
jgi:hypothetical protein